MEMSSFERVSVCGEGAVCNSHEGGVRIRVDSALLLACM